MDKEKEKISKKINLLTLQYTSANEYFKKNNLLCLEQDSLLKISALKRLANLLSENNYVEINKSEFPPEITPEYIYGYTSEERSQKFRELSSNISKQNSDLNERLNRFQDKVRMLNPNDLYKVKEQCKKKIEEYKKNIEFNERTLNYLRINFKKKWVPAPIFKKEKTVQKLEKINEDVPENTLRIYVGKTDYPKDNVELIVRLNYAEKSVENVVKLKSAMNFDEKFDWTFGKSEFKFLYRKNIQIEMIRSYWYKLGGTKSKGTLVLSLAPLERENEFEGDYKMELLSKRTEPNFFIRVQVRRPLAEKIYKNVERECYVVKQIFPEFKVKVEEKKEENINLENNAVQNNKIDIKNDVKNEEIINKI